jgi:hypothetical protein
MLVYCDSASLLFSPQEVNLRSCTLGPILPPTPAKDLTYIGQNVKKMQSQPFRKSTILGNERYYRHCKFDELVDLLSHAIMEYGIIFKCESVTSCP